MSSILYCIVSRSARVSSSCLFRGIGQCCQGAARATRSRLKAGTILQHIPVACRFPLLTTPLISSGHPLPNSHFALVPPRHDQIRPLRLDQHTSLGRHGQTTHTVLAFSQGRTRSGSPADARSRMSGLSNTNEQFGVPHGTQLLAQHH